MPEEQHPDLFGQLNGFDLINLDSALPEKVREQVALKVAHALKQFTDTSHTAIHVHDGDEDATSAVFAKCAKSWVTLVCDPALAIDALNADTPVLTLPPCRSGNDHFTTSLASHYNPNCAWTIQNNLDQPESRSVLVDMQREMLIRQNAPKHTSSDRS